MVCYSDIFFLCFFLSFFLCLFLSFFLSFFPLFFLSFLLSFFYYFFVCLFLCFFLSLFLFFFLSFFVSLFLCFFLSFIPAFYVCFFDDISRSALSSSHFIPSSLIRPFYASSPLSKLDTTTTKTLCNDLHFASNHLLMGCLVRFQMMDCTHLHSLLISMSVYLPIPIY